MMSPTVFDILEECIHRYIMKEVTNFRKHLQVAQKLAITLRHLETGETSHCSIIGLVAEIPQVNSSLLTEESSSMNSKSI